jgi:hypothetical protein
MKTVNRPVFRFCFFKLNFDFFKLKNRLILFVLVDIVIVSALDVTFFSWEQ